MKLRNLMYATMIACAFASCSKDEVVDNGGDQPEKADATLSLKFSGKLTKADTPADEVISSLKVYVFNADNTVTTEIVNSDTREVKDIKVSGGPKNIIVVANEPANLGTVASLSDLQGKMISIAGETDGHLSMNSKVYTVTIAAGKHNYLGYESVTADETNLNSQVSGMGTAPVYLYRNVAKANLQSIKVTPNAKYGTNATFKIEEVFVLHAKGKSYLAKGAGEWDPSEVTSDFSWINGIVDNSYSGFAGIMDAWVLEDAENNVPFKMYMANGYTADVAYYSSTAANQSISSTTGSATEINKSFYVYENTTSPTYETLLVVKGKFIYGNLTESDVLSTYYPVGIGQDGVGASQTLNSITRTSKGVLRNLQYNVALTVKSPGKKTPFGPDTEDDTILDVKVEVVPFGQVNQNVGI